MTRCGSLLACAVVVGSALVIAGCNRTDNAQIQHDAAQATEQAKQATKQAAAETKSALGSAENAVDAAASGVKQGIKSNAPVTTTSDSSSGGGKTDAGKIDLNDASHDQLAALPGITDAKADAIIAGRPYATPRSVVAKGILTPAQFHRIAPEVAVR